MFRCAFAALVLPAVALAAPTTMTHQGRLLDVNGVAVNGTVSLTASLHLDASTPGNEWTETHTSVPVVDGYYAITLGSETTLDSALFDNDGLHLSIVDGTGATLVPRQPLDTVPYAAQARGAASVSGPVVASSLTMPDRPAFSAISVAQDFNSDGYHRMHFDDTVGRSFDIGDHFDPSAGTFTAPVDGLYWLSAEIRVDDYNVSYMRLFLSVTTGEPDYSLPHTIFDYGTNWDPRYAMPTVSGVVRLDAGEAVRVYIYANQDTSWHTLPQGRFSGYLISEL